MSCEVVEDTPITAFHVKNLKCIDDLEEPAWESYLKEKKKHKGSIFLIYQINT